MKTESFTLREVTGPALERAWLDLPKKIYRGNRSEEHTSELQSQR